MHSLLLVHLPRNFFPPYHSPGRKGSSVYLPTLLPNLHNHHFLQRCRQRPLQRLVVSVLQLDPLDITMELNTRRARLAQSSDLDGVFVSLV